MLGLGSAPDFSFFVSINRFFLVILNPLFSVLLGCV